MNRRVYILSAILVILSAVLIAARVIYGGFTVKPEYSQNMWRISVVMNLGGKGEKAKLSLTLPRDTERQKIYNEHFENKGMNFCVREKALSGNRIGIWSSALLDGRKSIRYTFSAQLKSVNYVIPTQLEIPKDPEASYPPEFDIWLKPSQFIQSDDPLVAKRLKEIIGTRRKADDVVRGIYDFVREGVKYRSEKGSKDAKETLEKLCADCGGKARLFVALSRAAGIPSRLVGGLILKKGVKSTTHVWAECYLGGIWIPFDVVNKHYGSIPGHYLELYRGDYFLLKHSGIETIQYFFIFARERIPPVDSAWSLYALPLRFQGLINVLLFIPIGALIVCFFRTVIGIPTFGTFTPILLTLAFREISPVVGLVSLSAIVFLGCVLRRILDSLRILMFSRLSIIVTMVVIFIIIMSVSAWRFGQQSVLYISMFPMVIMTWIIERFSISQIEDGTRAAFNALGGTAAVAGAAYFLMELHSLRAYLFAFPELLLVVLALLLLLGRYTGIRLTELWRFREFSKIKRKSAQ
ncbi:MAG: UUP1 family membrane protein [Candidatus Omnitrophica bacterium]|nr:UUP1 family membrane protein [Candidatus Omnitrophota bacterium]